MRGRRIPISVHCPDTGEQHWAQRDEEALETRPRVPPQLARKKRRASKGGGANLWSDIVSGVTVAFAEVNALLDRIVMSGS